MLQVFGLELAAFTPVKFMFTRALLLDVPTHLQVVELKVIVGVALIYLGCDCRPLLSPLGV